MQGKEKRDTLKMENKNESTSQSNLKIGISCYQFCKCLKTNTAWVKTVSTEKDTSLGFHLLKHLVC